MPSKSKSQQRLFGMVRKCQKTGECSSPEIERIALDIGEKDAEDFAKTKHGNLPDRAKRKGEKMRKSFKEWVEARNESYDPKKRLKGKQKELDVAPPFGKIDGEDFKKLRKGKGEK